MESIRNGAVMFSMLTSKGTVRQSLSPLLTDPQNSRWYQALSADAQKDVIEKSKRIKRLLNSLIEVTEKDGKEALINHIKKTWKDMDVIYKKVTQLIKDDKIIDKAQVESYLSSLLSLQDGIANTEDAAAAVIVEDIILNYSGIIQEKERLESLYKREMHREVDIERPITPVERITVNKFLKALTHKDCFTLDYEKTKTMDNIVVSLKNELGREPKGDEINEVLIKEKQYIYGNEIVRNFGDHCFTVDLQFFQPIHTETMNDKIKGIKLYDNTHRIARIIINEVFTQKKSRLIIPITQFIKAMGYTTKDKWVYDMIDNCLNSLHVCRIRWTRKHDYVSGCFLNTLGRIDGNYIIQVNTDFLVCALAFVDANKELSSKEMGKIFKQGGGYINLLSNNPKADLSPTAYYLLEFLSGDSGNNKIKNTENGYKIIAYKVERFIKEAHLKYDRPRDNYSALIEAIEKLMPIIHRIEPPIEELKEMKPAKAKGCGLRIWVLKNPIELNNLVGETLVSRH